MPVSTARFCKGASLVRGGFRRRPDNPWSGGRIPSLRDIVAGSCFESSESFLGRRLEAACRRETTISVKFGHALAMLHSRRGDEQTSEEIALPSPNGAEDNPAAGRKYWPKTGVLPTVHVPAATAILALHRPRQYCNAYRDSTATVLQCVLLWRNAGRAPPIRTTIDPSPPRGPKRMSALW